MEAPKLTNSIKLKLYPILSEFIGCIELPRNSNLNEKIETVVILDRSGSMGNSVRKIVRAVLPEFFSTLSYSDEEFFHLIAFESSTIVEKIKIGDLRSNDLYCAGGTCMAPAVEELHKLFKQFKSKSVSAVRILTISDGEICDQGE